MRDLIGAAPEVARGPGIALLVLRLLLALAFLAMAGKNLAGDEAMAADFQRWGYADGFRVAVALAQVLGALLLVSAATAPFGAALLVVILGGAIWTHLRHDPPASALSAVAFLVPVLAILVLYRPPALR